MRSSWVAAVAACVLSAGCGSSPEPRAADPSPSTAVQTTVAPTVEATEELTSEPPAAPTTPAAKPSTRRPSPAATTKAPPPPPADGGISTNRKCETAPAASTGGPGRQVSPEAPLDLLITGDSLQESMGPRLAAYANAKSHMVAACTVPKYSTGLVRDDFFDWPAYARQLAAQRGPEAVSFMIGGNDGQNMSVNGRVVEAGSAEWAAEYQRRAASVMRAFTDRGAKVYWIGMPIARSERLTRIYRVQNDAVRRAAQSMPGVAFVDIWPMFAPNGRYEDSFANEFGTVERMRSSDGIHLSVAGAAMLARTMLKVLDADWHLTP